MKVIERIKQGDTVAERSITLQAGEPGHSEVMDIIERLGWDFGKSDSVTITHTVLTKNESDETVLSESPSRLKPSAVHYVDGE